jgi:hypothetical protein
VCLVGIAPVQAQFQMPDPKQMSGIPRPVSDLPDGSISVRVIRGAMTNNIENQVVELHFGTTTMSAKTDDAGRAQFDKVPAGATVQAVTTVDGERLESESFPAPAQGGIRLLLVATDPSRTTAASAPAVPGQVTIGGQSRVVFEPGDETLAVYYLLEIVNPASTPVTLPAAFSFDMPKGAIGTGLLQGSSPLASVIGTRVLVKGPFPPGGTLVQVGCELPVTSGTLDITQRFPAAVEQFTLIAKKVGDLKVASPQLASQQEMSAQGEQFIGGTGGHVEAGQPLTFSFSELPHHSPVPRWTALSLALGIVLVGVWVGTKPTPVSVARAHEQKRLVARRDKLLDELARLESDHGRGRVDDARYAARREEFYAALESVYAALDATDGAPADPGTLASAAG